MPPRRLSRSALQIVIGIRWTQDSKLTLKNESTPTKDVPNESLPLHQLKYFLQSQAILLVSAVFSVLGKDVFKLLWYESTFIIVRA